MTRVNPVWLVLASILSVQVGSAVAKGGFAGTHPVGIAFLRLAVAAIVLLPLTRPRLTGGTRGDWLLLAGFAAALTIMNTTFYLAVRLMPIGTVVTLEFLGPLTVALVASRRALDLAWVALAATGVALLGLAEGGGPVHPLGVVLALTAGAMWAGYIVVGARMGRSWETSSALALACAAGAVVTVPIAVPLAGATLLEPRVLLAGAGAGLLSTVIPYSLELSAMRRLPQRVFSILLSLEPAVAALAALVLLGERLGAWQWVAIACVVAASAGTAWFARRSRLAERDA